MVSILRSSHTTKPNLLPLTRGILATSSLVVFRVNLIFDSGCANLTHYRSSLAPLVLLVVLTFVQGANAADKLAVVIDVSGSMSSYGPWQADARDALAAVFAGHSLPSRWNSNPDGADLSSFSCRATDKITLIRFGSVQSTAPYPFFSGIQSLLDPSDIESQFPLSPSSYSEARTNKALAENVAIQSVADSSGTAFVIMISDFYSDANMSDQQLAFVNKTELEFVKYPVATLSWTGNPRVQIKFFRAVSRNNQAAHAPGSEESNLTLSATGSEVNSLQLLQPRYDEHSRGVHFTWDYKGSTPPEKYDLTVTDALNGDTLFRKRGLGGTSITYPKAAPGQLQWTVTAYMRDGGSIEQVARFTVPGKRDSPVAVILLIFAIMALLGAAIVLLKKHGLPEFLAKFKRRSDAEI